MPSLQITTIGDASFEDVLKQANSELHPTANALRSVMAEAMPGITEVPWVTQGTVGYGVGAKKLSEHFCYLGMQRDSVNLGFFYGADLEDPEGLLEGSGKLLRHIKVRSVEEARRPSIRRLVERASTHLPRLGPTR